MVQQWLWVSDRSAVESLVHNQAGSGCYDAVGTDDIAADDDLDSQLELEARSPDRPPPSHNYGRCQCIRFHFGSECSSLALFGKVSKGVDPWRSVHNLKPVLIPDDGGALPFGVLELIH